MLPDNDLEIVQGMLNIACSYFFCCCLFVLFCFSGSRKEGEKQYLDLETGEGLITSVVGGVSALAPLTDPRKLT